jgi:inositol transport system ATP-binding protein
MDTNYIIQLKGISKSFPGVKALDDVNLNVKAGTVHALCGENGAGKSTLMKIINGIYTADSGEIIYKGKRVTPRSPRQMLDMGIATIHQELNPILEMSIAENVFLGREPKNKLKFLEPKVMVEETQKLLDKFGLCYHPRSKMKEWTISDMQLIEIVKAISRGASLIIMDEPTSSISQSETQRLFSYIHDLRQHDISIVYISHKLEEIHEICDEVTVLRDGKWVDTRDVADANRQKIIELMVGRKINDVYPKEEVPIGDVVLEVEGMTGKRFKNVSFKARAGEILGFPGLVGAGRTELFRSLFGLDHLDAGVIRIEGKEISIRNPQDAIKNNIIMSPEDRKKEGVVLCRPIRENISLPNLRSMKSKGFLNLRRELKMDTEIAEKLAIKMASINDACASLSGGNQQKVVLSKWLLQDPKVLILDEPTRGIDVGAKYEIYKLMCQLAKQGVAVIMVSSELPEIIGMCDRVVVMSCGEVAGELTREEMTQEKIMSLAVKGFDKDEQCENAE